MDRAQLFTAAGEIVATVDVTMTDSGRWPRVITFRGHHYALENGRYVQSAPVNEATLVAKD